jgi:hypothetical protein
VPPLGCVALMARMATGFLDFSTKPARGWETLRPISKPQVEHNGGPQMKASFQLPLFVKDRHEVLVLANNSVFSRRSRS